MRTAITSLVLVVLMSVVLAAPVSAQWRPSYLLEEAMENHRRMMEDNRRSLEQSQRERRRSIEAEKREHRQYMQRLRDRANNAQPPGTPDTSHLHRCTDPNIRVWQVGCW